MPADTLTGIKATRKLLEEVCQRNISAEMHCSHDAQQVTARIRLLTIQGRRIGTDRPRFIGVHSRLRRHQHAVVHFLYDGVRYMFRTRVIAPTVLVHLNARTRVIGTTLHVPDKILVQQRRAYFRISIAGRDTPIQLHLAGPADLTACPISAAPFVGRITNLSAGGLCMLVKHAHRARFALLERLWAQFTLPDVPDPFLVPIEVRNFRTPRNGDAHLVGARFLHCDSVDTRSQITRIHRFVVTQQRHRLQPRR